MKQENFFNSYHCKSRVHCSACRSINDSSFRQNVFDNFSNINSEKFDCPHKIPWGFTKNRNFNKAKIITFEDIKNNLDELKNFDGLEDKINSIDEKIKNEIVSWLFKNIVNDKNIKIIDIFDEDFYVKINKKYITIKELKQRLK